MTNVVAFDIETKNLSSEIGGWGNTHMFLVSTVATWDGQIGKAYLEEELMDIVIENTDMQVLPLRQLKYDLDDMFKAGTKLLGHNIVAFDLPVLRDSLDIYCVRKFLNEKQYIDTSQEITKQYGERISLQNLVDNTLGETKSLESVMAPALWKAGEYQEVVDYCLKDCKLVYDLYNHGLDNELKAFSIEKEEFIKMEMEW